MNKTPTALLGSSRLKCQRCGNPIWRRRGEQPWCRDVESCNRRRQWNVIFHKAHLQNLDLAIRGTVSHV